MQQAVRANIRASVDHLRHGSEMLEQLIQRRRPARGRRRVLARDRRRRVLRRRSRGGVTAAMHRTIAGGRDNPRAEPSGSVALEAPTTSAIDDAWPSAVRSRLRRGFRSASCRSATPTILELGSSDEPLARRSDRSLDHRFTVGMHSQPSGPTPVTATMTKQEQHAMTPDQALARLAQGNARFVNGDSVHRDLPAQVRSTASGQFPFAIVLACIDSKWRPRSSRPRAWRHLRAAHRRELRAGRHSRQHGVRRPRLPAPRRSSWWVTRRAAR